MASQKQFGISPGYPLVLGANKILNGCNFAVEVPENQSAALLLYHKGDEEPAMEIPFDEEYRTGQVCTVLLSNFKFSEYEYNFLIDGQVVLDPCAYSIHGREHFGMPMPEKEDVHKLRCGFLKEKHYDWQDTKYPNIPYQDMILYKVHVRGYTKQLRNVKKKGTFAGLTEMIPYWKELGVNAIELMPAYEFMEVAPNQPSQGMVSKRQDKEKVNYWGYGPGFYFSPKRSYCGTKDPEKEFKDFIRALHQAGMECIMEMFFPAGTKALIALRSLQFWRLYYHVDGFHLLGDGVPLDMLLTDSILADAKLMAAGFDYNRLFGEKNPGKRNLAEYNLAFQQDMRRFLKSDEDIISSVIYHIKHNPDKYGTIQYMVGHDGFTLNDLVTYNYKHNEANGEDNADGSSYNYSWNCGVEGPSRKLAIQKIRERQMRNAFLLSLLSQGTPMIYGGDEIGNSQDGNNNAYCQDNSLGWIDWRGLKKNQRLLTFVKEAIAFRREHPILHMAQEMKGTDYLAKGFPDISFHGERAWYCTYENTCRLLGVMYCGGYAKKEDGTEDDFLYVGYNFHWEARDIALPNLPEGYSWKKIADTGQAEKGSFFWEREEKYKKTASIAPRTIVVLMGKQEV